MRVSSMLASKQQNYFAAEKFRLNAKSNLLCVNVFHANSIFVLPDFYVVVFYLFQSNCVSRETNIASNVFWWQSYWKLKASKNRARLEKKFPVNTF